MRNHSNYFQSEPAPVISMKIIAVENEAPRNLIQELMSSLFADEMRKKNIYTACYQLNTLCNTVRLGVPSEFSLNPRFVSNMRIWSKTLLHTFSTVQNTLKSIFSKKKTQLSLEVAAQTPKKYRRTFRRCEGTTIRRKINRKFFRVFPPRIPSIQSIALGCK